VVSEDEDKAVPVPMSVSRLVTVATAVAAVSVCSVLALRPSARLTLRRITTVPAPSM